MSKSGGIEAGKAFVKFLLDDKEFHKGLAGISSKFRKFGAIGAAASVPVVAAFGKCLSIGSELGGQLSDLSARTGIAASALSALSFVADNDGVSLEELAKKIHKMQVLLGENNPEFMKTVRALGVNLNELKAQSPDEQFAALGAALAGIENPAKRAAMAQKIFGKGSEEILPIMAKGADAFRRAAAEAKRLGATLGDDEVAVLDEYGDALANSKKQLIGLASHVAAAVAGPLTEFLKWSQEMIIPIIDWIRENPVLVQTILAVAGAVLGLSTAGYLLGGALAFIAANPVAAALIGITALVVGLMQYFGVLGWYVKTFGKILWIALAPLRWATGLLGKIFGQKKTDVPQTTADPPPLVGRGGAAAVRVAPSPAISNQAEVSASRTASGRDESIAYLRSMDQRLADLVYAVRHGKVGLLCGAD